MTITINHEPVDFSLDGEATVGELTVALQDWARSQGAAVLGVLADGKAADAALPLEGISAVDVEVVPLADRDQARLDVVLGYLDRVAQAATEDPGLLPAWEAEWPSVRAALAEWGTPAQGPLTRLDQPWDPGIGPAVEALAAELRAQAAERTNPEAALEALVARLEAFGSSLGDLAVHFQKGRDAEAFQSILELFTAWESLGRLVPTVLVRRGQAVAAWSDLQAELAPFFHEVEAALGSQDYILVTDLLEYEVVPRLQTLRTWI